MMCCGSNYEVPKYKDYRNRLFTKYKNRIQEIIRGIKGCSLTGDDKKKLVQMLLKELEID